MFQITIAIEGRESARPHHELTADEAVILDQLIAIDGKDAVIIDSEDIHNGSGRVCGAHMVLTEGAWTTLAQARNILLALVSSPGRRPLSYRYPAIPVPSGLRHIQGID